MYEKPLESHEAKGPALAAMVAAGIGCTVMGILTILVEASPHFFKVHLNFYNPVGPLSGVSILAALAYLLSWAALSAGFAGKRISEVTWLTITFALVGLGFLFTFPLFYQLFTVAP